MKYLLSVIVLRYPVPLQKEIDQVTGMYVGHLRMKKTEGTKDIMQKETLRDKFRPLYSLCRERRILLVLTRFEVFEKGNRGMVLFLETTAVISHRGD